MDVPGWPVAFRGSAAVTTGLLTEDRLRGPRFRRLFPDTYVRADDDLTLLLRSLAAYRYVEGRGVLSGWSAAEVLGASCGPPDAPAEVTVPGGPQRAHPGLVVHRDRLAPGERRRVGDVEVTHAVRTAWDLARRLDLVEGVVGVDRLANHCRFNSDLVLNFLVHYRGARGNDRVCAALAHAERYSGSPMETRLRMVLVGGGLPRPHAQWVVQDPVAREAVWLDLAYPEHRVAVEYDGEEHTTAAGVRRDIARATWLVDRGWRLYRYTAEQVYGEPELVVAQVGRALHTSTWTRAGFRAPGTPLTSISADVSRRAAGPGRPR